MSKKVASEQIFQRYFDCCVMFICLSLFDELVNDISVNVHERDCVVYVAFPNGRFVSSIFEDLRFEFSHVDISKN